LKALAKNCVVAILSTTNITSSEKLRFIVCFVPKLIQLLQETSIWKEELMGFTVPFRHMNNAIFAFACPAYIEQEEYAQVLPQFPESGFPANIRELQAFMKSNLLDKYKQLNDQ
jgi:hypothetical protein